MDLPVEITAQGMTWQVSLQDLSRSGMFLRMAAPFPVGTELAVALVHEGRKVTTQARVTHSLPDAEARSLGRVAGVGIAFQLAAGPMDHLFAIAIDRLVRERLSTPQPAGLHVVIADRSVRVLERMSTALDEAGCMVAIATTGMEVLAACQRRCPDVVIVDKGLSVMNGLHVLAELAADDQLAAIPVILTSDDPVDIEVAFAHGALDFMQRPYTSVEVIARARRLPAVQPVISARVLLTGSLSELPLPALLTMLEQERKSGRLMLFGARTAWIDIADGRIVGAGCAGMAADTQAMVVTLLDATHGTFELHAPRQPRGRTQAAPEVAYPITHLLLEHARQRDEARRAAERLLPRIQTHRVFAVA